MQLRDYQEKLVGEVRDRFARGIKRVLMQSPTGSGKCLGRGTPVLMSDGMIKAVENVKAGDLLMGDDSTPRTVLSVSSGVGQLYKITPVKGDPWICNDVHVLSLIANSDEFNIGKVSAEKGCVYDIPLDRYIKLSKTAKHCLKQYRVPVTEFYKLDQQLPIDSWVFGVWLAEGNKWSVNCFHFNDSNKVNVSQKVAEVLAENDFFCYSQREKSNHGIKLIVKRSGYRLSFKYLIQKIFNGKILSKDLYIPHIYKTASYSDRLKLLAGILDGDGSIDKGSIDYCSSSKLMANDVAFLARSLGLAAYITERTTTCNGICFVSYRLSISGDLSILPCARLRVFERQQIKSVLRTGFKVEPLGFGEYFGFTIDGNHRFLLGDFTVTHNTKSFCHVVKKAEARNKNILVLAHREELIYQARDTLRECEIDPGIIMSGYPPNRRKSVQVASIPTLVRRLDKIDREFDLIVYDECFPAGTLVDGRPIEKLKIGDFVHSIDRTTGNIEQKRVTRIYQSQTTEIAEIRFTNGESIACTPNHPFLTLDGWIDAKNLCCNSMVLGIIASKTDQDGKNEQDLCFGSHEKEQSNEKFRSQRKSFYQIESDRSCSKNQGWERKATNYTGAAYELGSWLGLLRNSQNTASQVIGNINAKTLQSRCWKQDFEDSDRDRRIFSSSACSSRAGCQENSNFRIFGVESVQIYKSGRDSEFGKLCPESFVFNLEVEDNHTYMVGAENYVVHNCHHISAASSQKILERWPNSYLLGVTATPCRTDGKGLGDVFDDLVHGPQIQELIDRNPQCLVPPKYITTPLEVDLNSIKITAGDYNRQQLAQAVRQAQVHGDLVKHWKEYAFGLKTIVFAVDIEHSQEVATAYNEAGIKAAHLDGDTHSDVRKRLIKAFAAGEITVLTNVGLFGEGFDLSAIACVQIARPTKSVGFYYQAVGRALRPEAGKTEAIILDHAGCYHDLGSVTEPRNWTLSTTKQKTRREEEREEREAKQARIIEFDGTVRLVEVPDADRQWLNNLSEWLQTARDRGHKKGWVLYRFRETYTEPTMEQLKILGRSLGYHPRWAHRQLELSDVK